MSQIEELQSRITGAMDRIGAGLSNLAAAQDRTKQEGLAQALDEEKLANAQLEQRLKQLKAEPPKQADNSEELGALQAEVELLRNEVGNQDEKDALKAEVAQLRSQLDAAGDTAVLEAQIAELTSDITALRVAAEDQAENSAAALDQTALTTEINALKAELDAAQAAPQQPDSSEDLARQDEMLVRLDTELQQLRQANAQLRGANAALREANAAGIGDAGLINTAMEAEIEGLRATQASEQAQVNAVLAKLEPLLAGARELPVNNMPEGEDV